MSQKYSSVDKNRFFNEFEEQLRRLTEISNSRPNNDFTRQLGENLVRINQQLRGINNLSKGVKDKFANLNRQIQDYVSQVEQQKRIIDDLNNKNSILEREKQKCLTALQQLKLEFDRLNEENKGIKQQLADLNQQLQDCNRDLAGANQEIQRLRQEIQRLEQENQLHKENDELIKLRQEIQEKTKEIQSLKEQRDALLKDQEELHKALVFCEEDREKLKANREENLRHIDALTKKQQELEKQISILGNENNLLVDKIKNATKIIFDAVNKIQETSGSNPEDQEIINTHIREIETLLGNISSSLQNGGVKGGKKYKKHKKNKAIKSKVFRGGFTYGTSSSFKKNNRSSKNRSKSSRSSRSSKTYRISNSASFLFNRHKKTHKKPYKKK